MKFLKILQLSFNMLVHGKLRSWLTIIGIFIGVAAVVAIISIGQDLQSSVQSQIQGFGQDIISISSGSSRAFGGGFSERSSVNSKQLSEKDIQAIKTVPGVKEINGIVNGRATLRFQNQNISVSVQGWDPAVFKDFISTDIGAGRYLTQGDSAAAVLGYGIANKLFSGTIRPGAIITINGKPFRVVGVLVTTTGFGSSDNNVYISTRDARIALNNSITLAPDQYSSISVKASDPAYINDVSSGLEQALINSHHVSQGSEDFTITSAQALQQRFTAITSSITLFLAVIAAVSLLVGGIGVANTMFTSVLEKTRDIGVMKAIGAKNSDILKIFLLNSGILGLAGGLLGVIAGSAISLLLPSFGLGLPIGPGRGGISGVVASLNPGLLLFALLFSIIIGMISGAIPAYRASKLKPVEALRYE